MPDITTLDMLANARSNFRQRLRFRKATLANSAAGQQMSLYRSVGLPAQPAIPGAAAVVSGLSTSLTAGIPGIVAPGSPRDTTYIDEVGFWSTSGGMVELYDRLIQSGNLNGTLTTAQTVNTPAIPNRNGAAATNVEWALECYTDLGATGVTATISYTNQAGTAGRTTTVAIPATWRAGRLLFILTLQSGDTGIQSIQSVTLSATTGAAGAFGVTCLYALGVVVAFPSANIAEPRQTALGIKIASDTAISVVFVANGTSTGDVGGYVNLVQS